MPRMITWDEVQSAADRIVIDARGLQVGSVCGVPRGGLVGAALVAGALNVRVVSTPMSNTLVVDDLVDGGATASRYHPYMFDALFRKPHSPKHLAPSAIEIDDWLVFPWEAGTADEAGPADAVVRLLEHVGEDPQRDGLRDTPGRVLRALAEMTAGYSADIESLLTRTFAGTNYGGLVVVSGVDFVSLCEHHMLTFTGTASVGYIPGEHGNVVGLSKLARLVDVFAQRLQVQERMCEEIADALEQYLQPEGVGVVLRAQHSCLACRGARKANAEMVTSSLRGTLLDKPDARAEFMSLAS